MYKKLALWYIYYIFTLFTHTETHTRRHTNTHIHTPTNTRTHLRGATLDCSRGTNLIVPPVRHLFHQKNKVTPYWCDSTTFQLGWKKWRTRVLLVLTSLSLLAPQSECFSVNWTAIVSECNWWHLRIPRSFSVIWGLLSSCDVYQPPFPIHQK